MRPPGIFVPATASGGPWSKRAAHLTAANASSPSSRVLTPSKSDRDTLGRTLPFEAIHLATWHATRRLAESGVRHFADAATRLIYCAEHFTKGPAIATDAKAPAETAAA